MLLLQFVHLLSPSTTVSSVSTALEQLHISIFRQENVKIVLETSLLIKLNVTASIIDKAILEFKVAPWRWVELFSPIKMNCFNTCISQKSFMLNPDIRWLSVNDSKVPYVYIIDIINSLIILSFYDKKTIKFFAGL